MKKIMIILNLVFALTAISSIVHTPNISYAENAQTKPEYYAKVTSDDVNLYASPSSLSPNALFEIPKSYFLIIMAEKEDFYYARYNDVYGYVKKNQVSVMDGTPENPFYIQSFRVFSLGGLPLYSKPSAENGSLVAEVPYLAENLLYYGKMSGQTLVPDKSSTWYFCKYTVDDNFYQGYLYSIFCDKIEEDIPLNNETFPIITTPLFPTDIEDGLSGLSNTAKVLIVVGVSVPCAIILYLLIRPTLSRATLSKEKKTPFKRKRKADYFEFDESDLG